MRHGGPGVVGVRHRAVRVVQQPLQGAEAPGGRRVVRGRRAHQGAPRAREPALSHEQLHGVDAVRASGVVDDGGAGGVSGETWVGEAGEVET